MVKSYIFSYLSSCVYCADNPLKFIDPDGRTIVDADGNTIYTHENGWAKGVDKGTRRIGEAMMQTETGREQFNKMVDSKTQIQLILSNETINAENGVRMGSFTYKNSDVSKDNNGNYQIKAGEITIFEGSIKSYLDGTRKVNILNDRDPSRASEIVGAMNANLNEYIGAVAGHESVHAISQPNINLHVNKKYVETVPNQVKSKILWESMFKNLK